MSDRIAVMSHGVTLQVGNANEIYERPNCKFVADFIGETNFLTGKVQSQQGQVATVALPNGLTVHAETEKGVPVGKEVYVAIRPEKTHLRAQDGYENHFTGRVNTVVYIGTDTQYAIQLPGDQSIRVREQNSAPGSRPLAAEGDEVTVSFSAQAARVLME